MPIAVEILAMDGGGGTLCRDVLRQLPLCFGRADARELYAQHAETAPVLAASLGHLTVGFVSLSNHSKAHCDIHAMGVLPGYHRKGIGRALIEATVERSLRLGHSTLSVKTLAPDSPDPNYAKTRAFYAALSFRPVETRKDFWGPRTSCLIMRRAVVPQRCDKQKRR